MRVLYVTTISKTINAFLKPHIKLLINKGWQVDIATNYTNKLDDDFISDGCGIFEVEFSRKPLNLNNVKAYNSIKTILEMGNYDIIHTHTPIASAIVRIANKGLNKAIMIYTAHGFHFYKGAPFQNWLAYYPVERRLAKKTDYLITINNEDYERANKKMNFPKVFKIPGIGLDLSRFQLENKQSMELRKEIGIPNDAFILLQVGELNKNKNHKVILEALPYLNENIYYVICGVGNQEDELLKLVDTLEIKERVKFLGYREDISAICFESDVFVFPSKREGLGMAALEGMAAGLPLVSSNVHGIVDYSIDGKTGYTNDPMDTEGFVNSIKKLYNNEEHRIMLGHNAKEIAKAFDLKYSLNQMSNIYDYIITIIERRWN